MDKRQLKSILFRNSVILGLILLFWIPMLTFYNKYVSALSSMNDDAEDVAESYEQLLHRGILIARIVLIVLLVAWIFYLIFSIVRAILHDRKRRERS
ncbi:MAG: hypothetical protein IKS83_07425 [Victivallales bacterium]|nr:hypothetical protein [Victivallales bacterium]